MVGVRKGFVGSFVVQVVSSQAIKCCVAVLMFGSSAIIWAYGHTTGWRGQVGAVGAGCVWGGHVQWVVVGLTATTSRAIWGWRWGMEGALLCKKETCKPPGAVWRW